jgi:hypothetical protein
MKINKWTLGLAALGLVSLSPALQAQTAPAPEPAPAPAAPTPAPIPMLTTLSATTISGYVDTSAVWNPGTGNANPAPYAFNAGKQDGFNIDSVDVKIAKPQDEGKWSAGYVAELMFGPDGTAITGGGGFGSEYIRQAYVTLATPIGNGLDFQLGRWDNILGYESNDDYKNPNWTRSYGYSFEPTEHTGLLASYKFCDAVSVQVGAADTLTTIPLNTRTAGGAVVESKKAIVSLLSLTAPDSWGFIKGSGLYGGFDHGPGAYGHDTTEWYVGATVNTPVKDLTLGGSWDSVQHINVTGNDAGYVGSLAAYASYKLTEKLTLNGRFEYAWGDLGALADANNLGFYAGGTPVNPLNKVVALTGTLQYDLWANVITRLEVRWDHAANGADAFGGDGALGTAKPDKLNEVLIAANVIYKF